MKTTFIAFITLILAGTGMVKAQDEKNTFLYKTENFELILLSETEGEGNEGILIGATPAILKETMPDGTFPNAVNAFLLKTPGKNYLFDTGFGRELLTNMKSVGVTPDDVHTVVITHMHGDHTGGLIKDGKNVFPNAVIQLSDVEKNYWTNDAEMNKLPENKQGGFRAARNVLDAYGSNIQTVSAIDLGKEKGDGVFFIKAYGHTPGHIGCLIKFGNDRLLIWGDLAHAMAVQMPYPQVAVTYDVNPELAIESRKQILEYVSKNNIPVAGMHIPFPGIGKIEKSGNGGYRFIPVR